MKRLAYFITSGLLVIMSFMPLTVAAATGDCDSNAIIHCGITSKAELSQKFSNGDGSHTDIRNIYHGMGISKTEIMSDGTVNGTVTKDGQVVVGGKAVATNARSLGRKDMPGSTANGSYFSRPTSVSFQQDSLPAYVYMKGGRFQWAIIKSCGNPVTATPVAVAQPAKPPVVPTPAPIQVQAQVQTVVVNDTVPTPPPPAPTPLPRSGASLTLLPLFLLAIATAWYHHSRSRIGLALRHVR